MKDKIDILGAIATVDAIPKMSPFEIKLAPPQFINLPSQENSGDVLDFWIKNTKAVYDMFRLLPPERHLQNTLCSSNHACGTSGCAVGWAWMFNTIPGFQYFFHDDVPRRLEDAETALNGWRVPMWDAIRILFGGPVGDGIFGSIDLSQRQLLSDLKRAIKTYRDWKLETGQWEDFSCAEHSPISRFCSLSEYQDLAVEYSNVWKGINPKAVANYNKLPDERRTTARIKTAQASLAS